MTSEEAGSSWTTDEPELLVSGTKKRRLTTWQKIGVAMMVMFVFLTFIWVDYALQAKQASKQPELPFQPKLGNYRAAPLSLEATPEIPAAPTPPSGDRSREITPENSPLLAYGVNGEDSLDASSPALLAQHAPDESEAPVAGQVVPALLAGGMDAGTPISARLKPTQLQGSKASLLPHPDFLITKGTIMPCTLQTAINTELAGYVKCVLPEAVRGTTGSVVLLDRGTTVVGEIQTGLSEGQRRAFILWDRAETPSHAIVSLASPGADELGRSGVPGTVNNHFWQRFGGALMLSVVQGSFQTGTAFAGQSDGNANAYLNNFQSNGQQVADTALKSSITIRPTLEKRQGETVSIFVARDIDFSDVYSLRAGR